jgi:hypothetical protein
MRQTTLAPEVCHIFLSQKCVPWRLSPQPLGVEWFTVVRAGDEVQCESSESVVCQPSCWTRAAVPWPNFAVGEEADTEAPRLAAAGPDEPD